MIPIKAYYKLTKPGIVYGNLLSMIAGFMLASKGHIDIKIFIAALIGVSLIIASGCTFNNFIDKGIDKKMARTMKRAIVSGDISGRNAIIYATVLGLIGFTVLGLYTNLLTLFLGLVGFFVYVVVYGIAKRHTIHGTIIGSISGAMPLVAGYTAVSNRIDMGAVILFLILAFWQMPHFYAIAIYRLKDYTEAGLVLWPIKKGVKSTKIQMLFYTIVFAISALMLTVFGYKGDIYFVLMLILSIAWVVLSIKGFTSKDDNAWGRKMFFFSLIALLFTCAVLSIPII